MVNRAQRVSKTASVSRAHYRPRLLTFLVSGSWVLESVALPASIVLESEHPVLSGTEISDISWTARTLALSIRIR